LMGGQTLKRFDSIRSLAAPVVEVGRSGVAS
jgi:hypothetical protein